MNKKLVVSLFAFATLLFSPAALAAGDVVCQPIYGGGQTCVTKGKILLNKTVQCPLVKESNNPQDCKPGQFVDNLSVNNPRFAIGQTVTFQLSVTNTGDSTLSEVTVEDIFPEFVSFVSGPGTFANGKLTFKVPSLNAGETRTFVVQGKIADNAVSANQSVNCELVNQAKAFPTANPNDFSDDHSRFCVERTVVPTTTVPTTTKGGLPVLPPKQLKETPATGPEMLALVGLVPGALAGFYMRRKAVK